MFSLIRICRMCILQYVISCLWLTLPSSLPLTELAPMLFPFFRHTIVNVRLAVVKTLLSFMTVPSLPRDWVSAPFLRLLFQNLIVEERLDIRSASLSAWRTALEAMSGGQELIKQIVQQQTVLDWYALMMTPLGVPIDGSTFYRTTYAGDGFDAAPERHNVDKNMLAQDLALVSPEVNLQARVAAATALAFLIMYWPSKVTSFDVNKYALQLTMKCDAVCGRALSADSYPLLGIHQYAAEVPICHRCRRMGTCLSSVKSPWPHP